jgi:hypothetical protein
VGGQPDSATAPQLDSKVLRIAEVDVEQPNQVDN